MTFEEFIENIRQEVREEGFISAVKLTNRIVLRAKEQEIDVDWHSVMSSLPCDNIHIIEYANSVTVDYRRKDLYYFNPDIPKKTFERGDYHPRGCGCKDSMPEE